MKHRHFGLALPKQLQPTHSACSRPCGRANVRLNPKDARVTLSLCTSFVGFGVSFNR
jgi:hypothetical protein